MHFTRQSTLHESGVPVIVRGEGHHIWDIEGKRYFDGISSLFTVQAGHGRKRLADAAAKQAAELAFFPVWSYAHPNAIELADRLAAEAPGDLNRVFFTTGGGEAVETAYKLVKQYWKLQGRPTKHKIVSRAVAYQWHPAGRPLDHRHPRDEGAVRAARARHVPRAEHELLPRGRDGLHPIGRRDDR